MDGVGEESGDVVARLMQAGAFFGVSPGFCGCSWVSSRRSVH